MKQSLRDKHDDRIMTTGRRRTELKTRRMRMHAWVVAAVRRKVNKEGRRGG